jgi:Flp pilus assembly protein TadB
MNVSGSLLAVLVLLMALGGVVLHVRRARRAPEGLRELSRYDEDAEREQDAADEIERKALQVKKRKGKKRKEPTVDEQLFMAGRLSQRDRTDYHRKKKLAPAIFAAVGLVAGVALGSFQGALFGLLFGLGLGVYLPMVILRKWVEHHHEELSYHLPLMIEQVAIGVSSSLDIGPCIARIVEMSDERGTHNSATRLLKYALYYVKSGVSLEEALIEIGNSSRHPEFKHAMLALSQVAKFGGEISRQLQDLADSVATQREAKVEARIRKLELKASGPVALVFVAYMLLLGLGIAAQALKNMPGM